MGRVRPSRSAYGPKSALPIHASRTSDCRGGASARWWTRAAASSGSISMPTHVPCGSRGTVRRDHSKVTRRDHAQHSPLVARKVYSFLADLPVHEIEVQEVLAVFRKIEVRVRYESARRLRDRSATSFSMALQPRLSLWHSHRAGETWPRAGSPRRHHRAPDSAPRLDHAAEEGWQAAARDRRSLGYAITRLALRMTPQCACARRAPPRRMERVRSERAVWSIPAEKMKVRWPRATIAAGARPAGRDSADDRSQPLCRARRRSRRSGILSYLSEPATQLKLVVADVEPVPR